MGLLVWGWALEGRLNGAQFGLRLVRWLETRLNVCLRCRIGNMANRNLHAAPRRQHSRRERRWGTLCRQSVASGHAGKQLGVRVFQSSSAACHDECGERFLASVMAAVESISRPLQT